ncbi:ABC transporter permease [Frankia sp. AgPm24]|uniref:ABC transporter permease n=1 Tax=Frankia umida TaxID=573489 RepID=A0ABT0K415_9ACTN|nr:ABC transporter permease [Frankia umida]MCK9878534.1 ABC transporter permease [Frankia umida]MCK9925379.1 ABC transporter permease [Frankia sp. AgPm24]
MVTVAGPHPAAEPTGPPSAPEQSPAAGVGRRLARAVVSLSRRPGLALSLLLLLAVLVAAFVPDLLTSDNPLRGDVTERLRGPSAEHWFGTDQLGRDLFARMVHGAALSLQATVLAVAVGLVCGAALGMVSGFFGGRVDAVIMRLVDLALAIPALLLALALITALGFGTVNIALAVGATSVAAFARVTRAEVLRVRTAVFVEAAVSCGARSDQVLLRHVLPHAWGPVLVLAALEFGTAVLAVSALSFLGFGAAPPTPEWGSLVADGRDYLDTAWWLTTMPGLTVVATVLAANRIARALEGERRTGR